ncbi:MAG: hypothetical protein ACFB51_18310 [Anaerolineae bacterium]
MNIEILLWLIPLPPLLAFFIIMLFSRGNKVFADVVSIGAMVGTWVLSLIVLFTALGIGG